METANYNPKETRKTIWTIAVVLFIFALLWKSPELLALFLK